LRGRDKVGKGKMTTSAKIVLWILLFWFIMGALAVVLEHYYGITWLGKIIGQFASSRYGPDVYEPPY
jgi:hypothetical protein